MIWREVEERQMKVILNTAVIQIIPRYNQTQ